LDKWLIESKLKEGGAKICKCVKKTESNRGARWASPLIRPLNRASLGLAPRTLWQSLTCPPAPVDTETKKCGLSVESGRRIINSESAGIDLYNCREEE
jgi:hypothetical protein